jgi:16S rRNA (adenine1518-N6/adenine1519-N6)-dimethyltransferase
MSRRSAPPPKKSLGQHFLRDEAVLRNISAAIQRPAGTLVVEVGPGTGQLTAALLTRGFRVLAIERDARMMQHLEKRFRDNPDLRVIEGDARDIQLEHLIPSAEKFAMAGNLPYFAASPIIRHFLECPRQPEEVVVMVQREVAREMAAAPGKFSMLSVGIQTFAEAEPLFDVPPSAFDPPPTVVSTVLRIVPHDAPLVPAELQEAFFKTVRGAFRHSRKQLHNSMMRGTPYEAEAIAQALDATGIDQSRRPETLTISEWLAVVKSLIGIE